MDRPPHPIAGPASPSTAPPTTYVHTDQTTFKELVQRLTGPPSSTAATIHHNNHHHHHHAPPPRPGPSKLRPKLTIVKPTQPSPFSQGRLSPSHNRGRDQSPPSTAVLSEGVVINEAEEERAIRERRFYLHPSPRSRVGGAVATAASDAAEPELLPLFPLTSPGSRSSSSSSSSRPGEA
uniref:VQ domain-containing protein n=1 Tax=Ananas comosus var. bracteatus TaxID=296719 RepID=A0A6V7QGX0_ANACO|nr:unnamed protein product [Ananas comosus var. bracteatus]